MKKNISSTFLISGVVVCSTVFAGSGPDLINMKTVAAPFSHGLHQTYNGSECSNCHKSDGGKIAGWGKEAAHGLCIPCHDLNEKGPVECKQCHK
jgi:predicted CXXCH cytochrome family protein